MFVLWHSSISTWTLLGVARGQEALKRKCVTRRFPEGGRCLHCSLKCNSRNVYDLLGNNNCQAMFKWFQNFNQSWIWVWCKKDRRWTRKGERRRRKRKRRKRGRSLRKKECRGCLGKERRSQDEPGCEAPVVVVSLIVLYTAFKYDNAEWV